VSVCRWGVLKTALLGILVRWGGPLDQRNELMAAFECPRLTLATFREAEDADRLPDDGRWNGCCVVIHKNGQPDEIAFWGYSGG